MNSFWMLLVDDHDLILFTNHPFSDIYIIQFSNQPISTHSFNLWHDAIVISNIINIIYFLKIIRRILATMNCYALSLTSFDST